jgi:hypothetical protein
MALSAMQTPVLTGLNDDEFCVFFRCV